ncbi:MAG: DUF1848 domain-containing protein [Acidimicrobiia bacterium]|nr:DUF1848 domain-containing protein [Acidimicrobiia bacterium]
MIISASYKTDIPTFFGEWFMNRLRAGFCRMVNPYNRRPINVSLRRSDVDGIVFWTKNVGPFMRHLPEVRERGFPFVVQHTINGYPRALEYSVVDASKSVVNVKRIADEYGPRVAVWRYDTIVVSSATPLDVHRRNFASLCQQLAGAVDEVVISFVHLYKKTLRNMTWASEEFGFTWEDPSADTKRGLAAEMVEMARAHGIQLSVCSQRDFIVEGAADARCIDAQRLEDIAGRKLNVAQRGARKECGCFASRDIGDYDTCPHGCVYCYAVQNRDLAQRRFREHDPQSDFLFPQPHLDAAGENDGVHQLPLFPGPGTG